MKYSIVILILASSLMMFGCRATAETIDYAVDYRYVILKAMYPRITKPLYGIIVEACADYHDNVFRVCKQIQEESGFRRFAISSKGAKGYMQLMPETAKDLGVTDITDARQNIRAGVRHLKWILKYRAHGDMELALALFNCGHNRKRIPESSKQYARTIMRGTLIASL